MALEIETLRKARDGAFYVSPERICLSAEGEIVACDDTRAVKLLVGKGGVLPSAVAEQYGLIGEPKDEPKARRAPNKARKELEDKGE